jgi:DHA3 family macrolide efflux protein-like MFS transporter
VFAIRRAMVLATPVITYLVAGPLADRVFEPMMAVNGPLAGSFGQILGVGQGRGIGLLFVCMGLLLVLVTAIGCLSPHLRHVEDELPDAETSRPIQVNAGKSSLMPVPVLD